MVEEAACEFALLCGMETRRGCYVFCLPIPCIDRMQLLVVDVASVVDVVVTVVVVVVILIVVVLIVVVAVDRRCC